MSPRTDFKTHHDASISFTCAQLTMDSLPGGLSILSLRPEPACLLDAQFYPDIFDDILQYADYDALLAFRLVSRHTRKRADERLGDHIGVRITYEDGPMIYSALGGRLPLDPRVGVWGRDFPHFDSLRGWFRKLGTQLIAPPDWQWEAHELGTLDVPDEIPDSCCGRTAPCQHRTCLAKHCAVILAVREIMGRARLVDFNEYVTWTSSCLPLIVDPTLGWGSAANEWHEYFPLSLVSNPRLTVARWNIPLGHGEVFPEIHTMPKDKLRLFSEPATHIVIHLDAEEGVCSSVHVVSVNASDATALPPDSVVVIIDNADPDRPHRPDFCSILYQGMLWLRAEEGYLMFRDSPGHGDDKMERLIATEELCCMRHNVPQSQHGYEPVADALYLAEQALRGDERGIINPAATAFIIGATHVPSDEVLANADFYRPDNIRYCTKEEFLNLLSPSVRDHFLIPPWMLCIEIPEELWGDDFREVQLQCLQ